MRRRLTVVLGAVAIAAWGGCTDLPSDPKIPFAVEFTYPASPSVVLGDTLRDSLGLVAPLRAVAFNVEGDTIHGAAVRFAVVPVANDSTPARVDATTGVLVIARPERAFAGKTFRVYAQVGGIQTVPIALTVTRRPDTLIAVSPEVQSMPLRFSDTAAYSPTLSVRLRHDDASFPADSAVPAYEVRYRIVSAASLDTAYIVLTHGSRAHAHVDTTDANGVAGRERLRVDFRRFPRAAAATVGDSLVDSVRVEARAYRAGGPVPGSPRVLTLLIKTLKLGTP